MYINCTKATFKKKIGKETQGMKIMKQPPIHEPLKKWFITKNAVAKDGKVGIKMNTKLGGLWVSKKP